jgi:hypothetical protein
MLMTSLKTNPQRFWKYVSNFKRKDNSFIQLKIDDQFGTDPKHIADEFATYFESIFNTSCLSATPSDDTVTSDFLPTALSLLLKSARRSSALELPSVLD